MSSRNAPERDSKRYERSRSRSASLPMRRKLLYLAVANFAAFAALALFVETFGRVFSTLWPAYDVLFVEPDRELGWKLVPGQEFTWAGNGLYAREFSTSVRVNSRGFRDRERQMAKPAGLRRAALLGGSFVEALQVPLEKTAGQLLEARLNEQDPPWEVLNFGVSNFGVGQYLLTWGSHAREFAPDVVFVFIAEMHFHRTVKRFESGAFLATKAGYLWVRPTFRLEGESLVREPARDIEEFRRAQEGLIDGEFEGRRVRVRKRSPLGHHLLAWLPHAAPDSQEPLRSETRVVDIIDTNMKILAELARQTRLAGSQLVIVDASRYFLAQSGLPARLRAFAADEQVGYVPLWAALMRAQRAGEAMQWRQDRHFTEAGHEVFASALHQWMTSRARPSDSGARGDVAPWSRSRGGRDAS